MSLNLSNEFEEEGLETIDKSIESLNFLQQQIMEDLYGTIPSNLIFPDSDVVEDSSEQGSIKEKMLGMFEAEIKARAEEDRKENRESFKNDIKKDSVNRNIPPTKKDIDAHPRPETVKSNFENTIDKIIALILEMKADPNKTLAQDRADREKQQNKSLSDLKIDTAKRNAEGDAKNGISVIEPVISVLLVPTPAPFLDKEEIVLSTIPITHPTPSLVKEALNSVEAHTSIKNFARENDLYSIAFGTQLAELSNKVFTMEGNVDDTRKSVISDIQTLEENCNCNEEQETLDTLNPLPNPPSNCNKKFKNFNFFQGPYGK